MKVVIKNWIEVNDLSSGQHSVNKNIRPKNSMFRSDLCDYSDTYIVIKGGITVEGDNGAKKRNKKLIFKKNAPFRSFISRSVTHLLTVQNIHILYPYIIC